MLKLRRLLGKKQDIDEIKQDIDNIPETLIEDIILEEQKELGKVRKTTTSYLRSRYGSAIVDRTLRRLDKRRQRGQEPEGPEENETFSLSDLANLLKSGTKKVDSL